MSTLLISVDIGPQKALTAVEMWAFLYFRGQAHRTAPASHQVWGGARLQVVCSEAKPLCSLCLLLRHAKLGYIPKKIKQDIPRVLHSIVSRLGWTLFIQTIDPLGKDLAEILE